MAGLQGAALPHPPGYATVGNSWNPWPLLMQRLLLLLPACPLQIDFLPFKCGSCGKVYW